MTVQPPTRDFASATRPGGVFAPIQREFERLLDQFGAGFAPFAELDIAPRMDVRDTAEALEITVELPGIADEDVKVTLEDEVLTVSGEKKTETERKEAEYRVGERRYGAFSRSIHLPASVDAEKLAASMDKGVLKIVAPKNGKSHSKTIQIQAAK